MTHSSIVLSPDLGCFDPGTRVVKSVLGRVCGERHGCPAERPAPFAERFVPDGLVNSLGTDHKVSVRWPGTSGLLVIGRQCAFLDLSWGSFCVRPSASGLKAVMIEMNG